MTIDLTEHSLESVVAIRPERARLQLDTTRSVQFVILLGVPFAALLNSSSPVGLGLVDAMYRGFFAGVVIWLSARARRWTWPIMAGLAAVSTGSLLGQVVALTALGIAAASFGARRRHRLAGAAIAAVSIPALLAQGSDPLVRLSGGAIEDPFMSSAVITLFAVTPAMISGWSRISRRKRSRIRLVTSRGAVAIGAIVLLTAAVAALSAPAIRRAAASTRNAIEFAADGDLDASSAELNSASADWQAANRLLAGPWMVPGRLVPIVGPHVRASQVISGQASALTASASMVADRLDPELLVIDGSINIAELDAIKPAVDALAATADRASVRIEKIRSRWLLPFVGEAITDALGELGPAAGQLGAAAEALNVGVDLIGGEETKRIVVMFSTPAEARGSGGFVGSWAEFGAADGRISLTAQYRSSDLNSLLEQRNAVLIANDDYTDRYERFNIERHIQDVTISPDAGESAEVAALLYAQATGSPIDAVLLLDPFVLEALLDFTGPVAAGSDFELTASNAADELLADQYTRFAEDDSARVDLLNDVAAQMVERLLVDPPDPIDFAQRLAPLAEQGRITLWLAGDADRAIVERLGLSGAFPRTDGDVFALVHQNSGQNKIDTFLRREIDVVTTLETGSSLARHAVTVRLFNDAPARGLPDAVIGSNDQGLALGTNRLMLSMYSPLRLIEARLGDALLPVETQKEFDISVYTSVLEIGAGESVALSFVLEGRLDLSDGYDLTVAAQPLSAPDLVTWRVERADGRPVDPPDGWARDGLSAGWNVLLGRDEQFRFDLR